MDDKYVVCKRDNLIAVTDGYVTFKEDDVLPDAVVIRRQDKFASPALFTYANMIAMVAVEIDDPDRKKGLLAIADYFHRQAELAGDEAFKLPD